MPVREAFVRLHRWVGLAMAAFLVVAGLTGSVIVFNHELDEWLNPELYRVAHGGTAMSTLDIAARIDAEEPRRRVTYVPLAVEPGHTLVLGMASDTNPATGAPYDTAYHEVFVDPTSGARLSEREWGACCLSRKQLLPFLYSIHYSLHLPEVWGMRVMGAVGIAWLLDSFVGFYLTLPARRRRGVRPDVDAGPSPPDDAADEPRVGCQSFWQQWRPAWRIKTDASFHRLNFDWHRASGLWLYPLLVALALSGVYLALRVEVFRPAIDLVADVTPDPYVQAVAASKPLRDGEGLSYREIVTVAQREGQRRRWDAPFDVFYAHEFGVYGVGFGDHHRAGLGVPHLYFSASDGRILGTNVPGQGTRGDVFMQAMFPLHNGNILGMPGRVAISISGVIVALLSITGVVIWEKKRRGRRAIAERQHRLRRTTFGLPAGSHDAVSEAPRAARIREPKTAVRSVP